MTEGRFSDNKNSGGELGEVEVCSGGKMNEGDRWNSEDAKNKVGSDCG